MESRWCIATILCWGDSIDLWLTQKGTIAQSQANLLHTSPYSSHKLKWTEAKFIYIPIPWWCSCFIHMTIPNFIGFHLSFFLVKVQTSPCPSRQVLLGAPRTILSTARLIGKNLFVNFFNISKMKNYFGFMLYLLT